MGNSGKITRQLAVILFSALLSSQLRAAENATEPAQPAEPVSLQSLVDEALRSSPGIQASKRAYESARARVAAAWLPEDPMISADVEGQPELFSLNRTNNEYMAQQTIPFPSTLWLRGKAAAQEAQKAYQEYKEKERDVIWHLERPYYELFLARKTSAALEETQVLADRLSQAVQARYESNQAAQQDLLKARIESSKIGLERFSQKENARLAAAHISHLLGRPLASVYQIIELPRGGQLTQTVEALEKEALKQRPELRAMEIGIRRAKTAKWLERTKWLPEITGRIEARQFSGEDNIREYDTFLGLSVPVWSVLKGLSGEWKGAGKEVEAAAALYTEMKNEVLLAVHEAYSKVMTAQNAVMTYEAVILPQAKQQVEVALSAYEAGRSDLLSLVDAQRMLKEAQITYYGHLADYEIGLSDLRFAIGGERG